MTENIRQQRNSTAKTAHQAPAPTGAWQDGHGGAQIGVLWVTLGLASYVVLSLVARATLHNPLALQELQQQVPSYVYDRSLFVFGTAFLLDLLGLFFELKSSRLDVVLLPAFVKGTATLTNILMRTGWATVAYSTSGRVVLVQRLVCWLHTTPTILVLVNMMSASITRQQVVRAVVCVEVMVLTGMAGSLTSGWVAVFWGGLSHLAFLPLLAYLHQGLKEASAVVSLHAARPTMTLVYYLTVLMWTGFGVVWDLRAADLIDTATEEVAYLCCDFAAKVLFSAGLMLSSFKGLDARREVVMRQIQEAHKQTLILELKRAIEQKDAFMSSVSHELRTPLNGIIGVSEGLLANCCGPLSESVRKQLFVVRTSGARLLALINDVMDAATLRQHRLVLKQERLDLRQVVGDVVDLTRSLVDSDVSLRNAVPEGLEVWADSGRIIQVLNNLLGNAAKFTHQGSIRVSAKWHDEQHQWVAIQVWDTGIGIPKQKLQSIFLPFEQVDGSISRQYGGFGLGLSITQELVKAHGGELWVKSKEHRGSQFVFTIPSFTGQTLLSPQQQQLQSRRSMPIGQRVSAAALTLEASRHRSSSKGNLAAAASPTAAAAADGSCNGTSHPPLTADLLGSIEGEGQDYAMELPYDAAQLSALASCKPFSSQRPQGPHSTSGSGSGSFQRVPNHTMRHASSMRSLRSPECDEDEDDECHEMTPVPLTDQRPTQFARSGRYQVLSADDDPVSQTVVQSLLASTGYEVVCVYSGKQLLENIEEAEVLPDLILLDMLMPDMSGPDVCRQLALRQPPLGVPIILVSALAEESSVVSGLDSGADDYVIKPFRRAEFLARIRGKLQLANAGEVSRQPSLPAPGVPGSDGPVVMCVTDDEVNHIVLEGILQSQNYRYQKVSSGAEALSMLEAAGSQPPHVLLLDAALPDTTGLEVLQTLRLHYSQVVLPVIMLIARHNEKAIVQALDAGANDYAVKPFRSELLARIRMHLRSSSKAAAALMRAPSNSAEFSFAGDFEEERMSAELQLELQRGMRLQQLSSVPLLMIELDGVNEALSSATAEQASQLMGFIADCFDSMVEKYAVSKIEASDTSLTVAAPLSMGSCHTSTRNSLQLPVLNLRSTQRDSGASLLNDAGPPAHPLSRVADAADPQQQYSSAFEGAVASRLSGGGVPWQAGALGGAALQLLQLAQEVREYLCIDTPPSSTATGASTPSLQHHAANAPASAVNHTAAGPNSQQQQQQQQQQQAGVGDSGRARPDAPLTPVVLYTKPQWWHGLLHVRVALHVGPLSAGVVGRRRPRYRLMGPALQACKGACAAAPADTTVATSSAAQLLQSCGVQGLKLLAHSSASRAAAAAAAAGGGGGVVVASAGPAASSPEQQTLWVVSAGSKLPFLQQQQHQGASGTAGFVATGTTDGVLSQAAASLAASVPAQQDSNNSAGLHGLMQIGSSNMAAEVAAASTLLQPGLGHSAQPQQQQQQPQPQQQQQQQPQQQQQQWATSSVAAAPFPLPGMLPALPPLPPLPPLPDSALAQQLMLQDLAELSQQLHQASALAKPVLACVGGPGFGASAAAATGIPVSAEHVSATLSLQDWQSSPRAAAAPAAAAIQEQQQGNSTGDLHGRLPADASVVSTMHSAFAAAAGASSGTLKGVTAQAGVGGGLLLAPADLQQISLLHQELALLQQQLNSACGTGLSSNGMATNGMVANGYMAQQYMPVLGDQMQAMQQQLVQQMQLQMQQPVTQCQESSHVPGQATDTNRPCFAVTAAAQPAAAEPAAAGADLSDVAATADPGDVSQVELLPSIAASSSAVSSAASVSTDTSGLSRQQAGVQGHSRGQGFKDLFRRRSFSSRRQQQ